MNDQSLAPVLLLDVVPRNKYLVDLHIFLRPDHTHVALVCAYSHRHMTIYTFPRAVFWHFPYTAFMC